MYVSQSIGFRTLVASVLITLALPVRVDAQTPPAVARYAPWVRMHPKETRWPADPAAFIASSRLQWHNSGSPCGTKDERADYVTIAPFGAIDAAGLGDGVYRFTSCQRDRSKPVREELSSADLTAPSAKGRREHRPRGIGAGFVLDVADTARDGIAPASPADYGTGPPVYYEYVVHRYVLYWFFFAYNDRFLDKHEGDWEHVVVRLDSGDRAVAAAYYTHRCSGRIYDWKTVTGKGWLHDGEHLQVYLAKRGHGAWPDDHDHAVACAEGYLDDNGRGPVWRTWMASLSPATAQPWYGYGGAWGQKSGPLGPSRFKLDGAVPPTWM